MLSDRALILGGAAGVWEDVQALEESMGRWDGIVCAVNDVGAVWPREFQHWVSLHPEKLPDWVEHRERAKHPEFGGITWSRTGKSGVDRVLQPRGAGSSGLLAVQAMRAIGVDRIVLCGMPMSPTPHFAESLEHRSGKPWTGCRAHWLAWKADGAWLSGVVKSMSGRTREFLGAPDREFLGLSS